MSAALLVWLQLKQPNKLANVSNKRWRKLTTASQRELPFMPWSCTAAFGHKRSAIVTSNRPQSQLSIISDSQLS